MLNDLCAAVWFSYLLIFLTKAEALDGVQAGSVLFAGQLADGLATPLVGLASDATRRGMCGLGRRKLWNFGGVVIVAINFLLVFGVSAVPGGASSGTRAAVLGAFAAIFNIGWAAVQVSHMALVPELSSDEGGRVSLNSARYFFTVLSNCAVFLIMLALLRASPGGTDDAGYRSPATYTRLTEIVLSAGIACSAVFILFCPEPPPPPERSGTEEEMRASLLAEADAREAERNEQHARDAAAAAAGKGDTAPRRGSGADGTYYDVVTWRDWLVVPDFWRVMGVYALVRAWRACRNTRTTVGARAHPSADPSSPFSHSMAQAFPSTFRKCTFLFL